MNFPQYRKYPNNKAYFKILSEIEFEEISYIGNKQLVQKVVATTYAERLYIADMLSNSNNYYLMSNESEYRMALK